MTTDPPELRCPHCSYRLDRLPVDRCPECGNRFDPARLRAATGTRHRRRTFLVLGATSYVGGFVASYVGLGAGSGVAMISPADVIFVLVPALVFGTIVTALLVSAHAKHPRLATGPSVLIAIVLAIGFGIALYAWVASIMGA